MTNSSSMLSAAAHEQEPEFVAPCTLIQKRFLEIQARDPENSLANIAMRWRLLGTVHDRSIEAALKLLARRHESLRTRFESEEGAFRQVVSREERIKLSLIDLSKLPVERHEAEADRIAHLEAQTPFDPETAPLWRIILLRCSPREATLLATFHHTIADGWSMGVFARELLAALEALEAGRAPYLPEIELQYADYARWQEAQLASDILADERRYWRRQMAGVAPMDVAATRNPPVAGKREGKIRSVVLPRTLSDRLQTIARQQGHTMFSLGAAGLAAALGRSWGCRELLIGTQVGGHDDPLLEHMIGPLVNTVMFRLDASLLPNVWEFANHVHNVASDALANKALPFEEIVAGVRLSSQSDLPLGYAVNFTMQDRTGAPPAGPIELAWTHSVSPGSLYDLSFFMVGRTEGWRISCEYDSDRHDEAAVDALIAAWTRELERLVETPAYARAPQEVAPTSEILAEQRAEVRPLMRQPTRTYFQPLALYTEGKLPPVFAISNASLYYPIARRVANDRPFIDLQWRPEVAPPPLDADAIPDIAADAARQIRAFDPVGPYYLVGYCLIGNVVLETAQQLRAAGSQVSMLFLLDTVAAGYVESMSRFDRLLRRLQLADKAILDLRDRIRKVRAGEMSLASALSQYSIIRKTPLGLLLPKQGAKPPEANAEADFLNHGLMDYLLDARPHYRAQPYDGDAVFFRASDARIGRLFARSFGWDKIIKGDLRVYDSPAPHLEMLQETSAKSIGEHMAWMMDKVEGRWQMPSSRL